MSEASIRQLEPIVADKVRLCVEQMANEARQRGCLDAFKWWCFLATDTIGELSFGESFRMLEKGEVGRCCNVWPFQLAYTHHSIEESIFTGPRDDFDFDDHPHHFSIPVSCLRICATPIFQASC